MKTGKEFEGLILHIQTCLANKAKVEPNIQLIDKESRRPRQIDILISIEDVHLKWRSIVEVRDHARKVDVGYVDSIEHKKNSVNANMAIIVSKSGFTVPAMNKAKSLGIRAFTYEEAIKDSWVGWFVTKQMTFINNRIDFVSVGLQFIPETFELNKTLLEKLPDNPILNELNFVIGDKKIPTSLLSLLQNSSIYNAIWAGITPCSEPQQRKVRLLCEQKVYLKIGEIFIPLVSIELGIKLTQTKKDVPLTYSALNDEEGNSIADVLSSTYEYNGQQLTIQMVKDANGNILKEGEKVYFRAVTYAANGEKKVLSFIPNSNSKENK